MPLASNILVDDLCHCTGNTERLLCPGHIVQLPHEKINGFIDGGLLIGSVFRRDQTPQSRLQRVSNHPRTRYVPYCSSCHTWITSQWRWWQSHWLICPTGRSPRLWFIWLGRPLGCQLLCPLFNHAQDLRPLLWCEVLVGLCGLALSLQCLQDMDTL